MPRLWRYKRDSQEFGPVTPDDLKLLADSKRLLPTDQVCKDGTAKWIPARSVRGLFDAPKAAPRRSFLAWVRRTGVVTPLLALLTVGLGVAFLVYAIHNSGGAAAASPAVAAAPTPAAPHSRAGRSRRVQTPPRRADGHARRPRRAPRRGT